MNNFGGARYHTLSYELKRRYNEKLYKVALNAGCTCPNRDGRLGRKGCIFCSAGGSGDFAGSPHLSIPEQLKSGKRVLKDKYSGSSYIAYFQAYTNTYAPIDYLRKIYSEAANDPEVKVISIATRPDCLSPAVLDLLSEINDIKPVWIELGLQSSKLSTIELIRRGYTNTVFETAVENLRARHIDVIVHVILLNMKNAFDHSLKPIFVK